MGVDLMLSPIEQPEPLTLDDIVQREGKLKILVISDIPTYNQVVPSVFTTKVLEPTVFQKRAARDLIDGSVEITPDILIFNISKEEYSIFEQLDLMTKFGLRFRYAALFGTIDVVTYVEFFGILGMRNETYFAIWNRLVKERPDAITHMYRTAYPIGGNRVDAEVIFTNELTQLLNSLLNPTTIRKIYGFRSYRGT